MNFQDSEQLAWFSRSNCLINIALNVLNCLNFLFKCDCWKTRLIGMAKISGLPALWLQ